MQELELAHRELMLTMEDVMALLKAIHVLVRRCGDCLCTFSSRGSDIDDGAVRGLLTEVDRLFSVGSDLGHVATAAASAARTKFATTLGNLPQAIGDDQNLTRLIVDCGQWLQTLSALEATIRHVEHQAAHNLEVLREAALRRDTAPDILATVNALLQRVRQPLANR